MTCRCQQPRRLSCKIVLTALALCGLPGLAQSNGEAGRPRSAAAVPGDDDLGDAVAHEFTYCESPVCNYPGLLGCERSPFLCVPDSWCRAEIQDNFRDSEHHRFFLDSRTMAGGMDSDPHDGIENAELLFYAGHGTPTSLKAWDNHDVDLSSISPGDQRARYWWMLSCHVMAHGPTCSIPTPAKPIPTCGVPPGPDADFLAPEKFAKDDFNAFAIWGTSIAGVQNSSRVPLNASLRMACGGSTVVGGYFSMPTTPIWHYKLMTQLQVADSFLLGLGRGYRVPLCMTRGRAKREDTPLYDQEFTRERNPAPDGDHLFMEYPVHLAPSQAEKAALDNLGNFAGDHPPPGSLQAPPPRVFPVLELVPTPLPSKFEAARRSKFLSQLPYGYLGVSADLLFGPGAGLAANGTKLLPDWLRARNQDVCVRFQQRSGAVTLAWVPRDFHADSGVRERLLTGPDLISLVTTEGLAGEQLIGPTPGVKDVKRLKPSVEVIEMMVDGAVTTKAISRDLSPADIDHHEKCLYIRIGPWLLVQGTPVPVFDEGSEWLLAGCPGAQGREMGTPPETRDTCRRTVPAQLNLSWVGRQVAGEEQVEVVSIVDAQVEALARLGRRKDDFEEPSYRWGYKAAPVHCTQSRMYLVYRFDFRPKDTGDLPVTIEVPAQRPPAGKRIDQEWICDGEVPNETPPG